MPNEEAVPIVDVALRHVTLALLEEPLEWYPADGGPLGYLRDRISVPREWARAACKAVEGASMWYRGGGDGRGGRTNRVG